MAVQVAAFVVITGVAGGLLSLTWPEAPVHIHVRWKADITDAERIGLERAFRLTDSLHSGGTTWEYQLADSSTTNIRTIIQNARVDDTSHLNRLRFRPEFAQDRTRQILLYSLAIGGLGSVLLLGLVALSPRTASFGLPSWSAFVESTASRFAAARSGDSSLPASSPPAAQGLRNAVKAFRETRSSTSVIVAALAAGVLATVAMTFFAGARLWSAAGALIVVYACGYVGGSLLVSRVESLSLAIIRTVAGLLLATIAFLLSLVLALPWFVGPIAVVATAVFRRGRTAFAWPHGIVRFTGDGLAAGALAVMLLSPIVISFFYMAPGHFPPVFYNVDIAYNLEKVHALVAANSYPPESLSNVGLRGTYHYGTQAMAALISRCSGLLPHHALFLIVLPMLTAGVVAAAAAVARYVAPALPRSVTLPLLLISTPSLSSPFWDAVGLQWWTAVTSRQFSIDRVAGDYALWGILSNEGQNVGGDFLILSGIAGIAAAPSWGRMLPAFLIGSAILVKTSVGIALVAGFTLAEGWHALVAGRYWPSRRMLMAAAVFIGTVAAFFVTSLESAYRVELFPLFHVSAVVASGRVLGFVLDLLWLFLPALIVLSARIPDPERRSAPILLMGIAPIIVVNTTHLATDGGGSGGDWMQVLHPVPFLLHAFALSLASVRWSRLGRYRRAFFLLTIVMMIVPVSVVATRYTLQVLRDRESGHEFVDNRAIAEALAAIPVEGSVIVTNDLRYPAQNFSRDNRQMQIPALFGHQAFAVNYAYEPVAEERRGLQQLLQRPEWSDAILEAARAHRWTHFVVRKDYVHPTPIPLEQIFENRFYAVFRFP